MNVFEKLNKEKYFLSTLLLLALALRLIVFIKTGNHNADGMYRTILTLNWLKDPYFITEGLWPPLDLYLMAFMMEVWKDPLVSPRLINLVFGVLIIIPYYYLVKLLFDKRTAAISAILLTFWGLHIEFSSVSMSEIPFLFFLCTSLYFFFRFKKAAEKRLAYLVTSAIFLNLASMIRYEAWLFVPLLTIFILNNITDVKSTLYLKGEAAKYFFMFLIISLVFPVFWMIGNYQSHRDFFFSQTWTHDFIKTNAALYPGSPLNPQSPFKKLISWPSMLFQNLGVISVFAGLGLIISLLPRKKNLEFLTIFLVLMMTFTYKIFNFTMTPQVRYILLPSLFLIPYFTVGLDCILKPLRKNWRKAATITLILYFIIPSSYTAIVKNPYTTPGYVLGVSNWLSTNVKPGEKVILDEYSWWGLHILVYSGFNTTFIEDYLTTLEFVTDQVRIMPAGGRKINETNFISYLEDDKPLYIVYSPEGELADILNLSSECRNEVRLNYVFECKYTTRNYNIYKLKPDSMQLRSDT
ncbi:MAG: glycosyltransferase family 39 protein [Candidatus Methanoperedens sp.]|nr:glycosyltransferase family 39 protein [Candidatus Methanoperedens sp.]